MEKRRGARLQDRARRLIFDRAKRVVGNEGLQPLLLRARALVDELRRAGVRPEPEIQEARTWGRARLIELLERLEAMSPGLEGVSRQTRRWAKERLLELLSRIEEAPRAALMVDQVVRLRAWLDREWRAEARVVETPEVPVGRRLAGWQMIDPDELQSALPLRLDLKRPPLGTVETTRYWVPMTEQLAGGEGDTVLVERSIQVSDETPVSTSWIPEDFWAPVQVKRVARRDFRTGYKHVWALEDTLKVIRRPYMLRLDLARVMPTDLRPIEKVLEAIPIPELDLEIAPMEWVTSPPKSSPLRDWPYPMALEPVPGGLDLRSLLEERVESPGRTNALASRQAGGAEAERRAVPGGDDLAEADGMAGGNDG